LKKKEKEKSKKRKRTSEEQLEAMLNSALERQDQFQEQETLEVHSLGTFNQKDSSKKAFFKEFKKVVAAADVVLEVLDARDPLGSRSPTVERQILNLDPNKKIILVLNKIDLIPKKNVEEWLAYLRNDYPTIAFKASTQQQRQNLGRGKVSTKSARDNQLHVSECLGADTLIDLLKNYSRSLALKQAISVGIIGFPNVGKSSIINSLKRSRAVTVGAKPGVTRTTQEVVLDKNIKLIDCPGIIFADDMSEGDAALRNCLNIDQLQDYTLPVQAILSRCTKEQLITLYKIPLFADVTDFLRLVAERRGKVLRGSIPDYQAAAKMVVQDWNGGRIPYYCIPPEVDPSIHLGAQIVSQWSEAFQLDNIMQTEKETVMNELRDNDARFAFTKGNSSKFGATNPLFDDWKDEKLDDDEEEPIETEVEGEPMEYRKESILTIAPIKDKGESPAKRRKVTPTKDPENPQINSEQKKKRDKIKKLDRKADNKTKESMHIESNPQTFDFGVDFWKNHPSATSASATTDPLNPFQF